MNQGPRGYCLMKKTRIRKSRDTVPLRKPPLSWKDLAPRRMPSWNPAMSSVYTERSLLHTWHPEHQLLRTLNAHTLKSKVRGLAHKKRWRWERQSSHTGWFLLAAALNGLYYCSNVS
jgi:hypothetical protein